MLEALRHGGGYAQPASGEDAAQVDPGFTGCPYADDTLLPVIRERGHRDQESPASSAAGDVTSAAGIRIAGTMGNDFYRRRAAAHSP